MRALISYHKIKLKKKKKKKTVIYEWRMPFIEKGFEATVFSLLDFELYFLFASFLIVVTWEFYSKIIVCEFRFFSICVPLQIYKIS